MKILIAVDSLMDYSSQANWAYTMAEGLTDSGNMVSIFTFNQGKYTENFNRWRVFSDYDLMGYDLIIANGAVSQKLVSSIIPPCKIFTATTSDISTNNFVVGGDFYVTNFEDDLQDKIDKGIPVTIIREPVNFTRFSSIKEINDKPLTILYTGSSKSELFYKIRETVKTIPMRLLAFDNQRIDGQVMFNQADIIITNGREAIEAMATKRAVIVCDTSRVDKTQNYVTKKENSFEEEYYLFGMVDDLNFKTLTENNFTGGYQKLPFDSDSLRLEIEKYDKKMVEDVHSLAIQEYSHDKIVNKYLEIYQDWKIKTPVRRQPQYDKDEGVQIRI